MRRLILPVALAVAATALTGCGNKGPLYLPPPPAAGATATPQPATPAKSDAAHAPPPASTSSQPFNSVIHP